MNILARPRLFERLLVSLLFLNACTLSSGFEEGRVDEAIVDALVDDFEPLMGRLTRPDDQKVLSEALRGAAIAKLAKADGSFDEKSLAAVLGAADARLADRREKIKGVVDLLKRQDGLAAADPKTIRFAAAVLLKDRGLARVSDALLDHVAAEVVGPTPTPATSGGFKPVLGNKPAESPPPTGVVDGAKPAEAPKADQPTTKPVLTSESDRAEVKEFLKRSEEALRSVTGAGEVETRLTAAERKAALVKLLDDDRFLRSMASKLNLALFPLAPADKTIIKGMIDELDVPGDASAPGTSAAAPAEAPAAGSSSFESSPVRYRYEDDSAPASLLIESVRGRVVRKHPLLPHGGLIRRRSYVLVEP